MEYLYDNYSSSLYGVIAKIISDQYIAEEVLHDCFLRIWDRIESFNAEKGRLFTWMVKIARNLAIDKLRSREYIQMSKSDDGLDFVSLKNPEYIEQKNIETSDIPELIKTLSKDQQELLEKAYFQGYSQTEIAEELSIPLGTVKTRVRAAILKLRKLF